MLPEKGEEDIIGQSKTKVSGNQTKPHSFD